MTQAVLGFVHERPTPGMEKDEAVRFLPALLSFILEEETKDPLDTLTLDH